MADAYTRIAKPTGGTYTKVPKPSDLSTPNSRIPFMPFFLVLNTGTFVDPYTRISKPTS